MLASLTSLITLTYPICKKATKDQGTADCTHAPWQFKDALTETLYNTMKIN